MNKKVGFLIMNFESGGGTERVTSVIANELVKKNFDVRIISCQHGNSCKFEIDKNITIGNTNIKELKQDLNENIINNEYSFNMNLKNYKNSYLKFILNEKIINEIIVTFE